MSLKTFFLDCSPPFHFFFRQSFLLQVFFWQNCCHSHSFWTAAHYLIFFFFTSPNQESPLPNTAGELSKTLLQKIVLMLKLEFLSFDPQILPTVSGPKAHVDRFYLVYPKSVWYQSIFFLIVVWYQLGIRDSPNWNFDFLPINLQTLNLFPNSTFSRKIRRIARKKQPGLKAKWELLKLLWRKWSMQLE